MGDQFWEKDWQDDAIEVAEKYYAPYRSRWKEQNPSSSRSETSAQPPQGKKRGIAAFVANQVAVSAPSGDATASPLLRFCKSAPELNSTSDPIKNPLKWWLAERSQGREHEGLTAMALDIFTAPVSSVGVERTFSFGRHLLQHTRHSLSEDSVCRSLAVGSWARKDIFPDGILHKSRLLATKAKKAAKAREKGKAKEQEQNLGSIVLDTDGDAESQDDEDEEEGWTDEE